VRRIAIANPQHAPYGRAAEAALRRLGVYDAVKEKLVFGENVAQAAQFVQSGAADAGIIALALAVAPALADEGRYFELPLDAYPRMDQGGIVLDRARDPEAARAFREFVLGSQGRAILKRFGFFLPGK
jgi:molybdate transport system substrate-binding protein